MNTGKWRLQVDDEFGAAHQLRNYGGKCEQLHGHNFKVRIEVGGTRLDSETGILLDFKVLKSMLKEELSGLDHRFLNDLPEFKDMNPSSENIAAFVYRKLKNKVGSHGVALNWVMVAEKEGSRAFYGEE
ncbi:MAG: 6-carboxytetrahydropterin synthase QueD [Thermodesulfobacteriota bacterium]